MPALLAASLFLAVPTSAEPAPRLLGPDDVAAGDCGQPCGYIIPLIDLEFPDKLLCGGGQLIYADEPPTNCYDLMPVGESQVFEGRFHMYWDAQEEPTYPINPDEPIVVTFSGTQSNPKWLDVKLEPSQLEITFQDLYDLDNYAIDPEGTPIAWFHYYADLKVTVTRTGDPSDADIGRMEDRLGVLPIFIKARSSESGAYYKEAFGVEEFRFQSINDPVIGPQVSHGMADPVEEEAPALTPVLVLAMLVIFVAWRRRL